MCPKLAHILPLFLLMVVLSTAVDRIKKPVHLGDSVILTCDFDHDVQLHIRDPIKDKILWYKNGKLIANDNIDTLTILLLAKEDVALYQCFVGNRTSKVEKLISEFVLVLIEPPLIISGFVLNYQYFRVGSNAEIKCEASGYPIPEISWNFGGLRKIKNGGLKYHISDEVVTATGNKISRLTIKDVQDTDAGVYFCEATSKEGESSGSVPLAVYATNPTAGGIEIKKTIL